MRGQRQDEGPGSGRSLAMQRIALDRARVFGLVFTLIGALGLVLAALLLVAGGFRPIAVAQLMLWAAFLVVGIVRLRLARRRIREFEAENGPGAGRR